MPQNFPATGIVGFSASATNQTTFGGIGAGISNIGQTLNSAFGYEALYANGSGAYNVAVGQQALYGNTTGNLNVALGNQALYTNTTGSYNVAIGTYALFGNTGSYNVAIGYNALTNNTLGTQNSALGDFALQYNTTGGNNVAVGNYATYRNTTGSYNISVGYQALYTNTTGSYNIAIGYRTLYQFKDTTSGNDYNIVIGNQAGYAYTGSERNDILIGANPGTVGESNMLRMGNPDITGGQIAFSMLSLTGFGVAPIYGIDNRMGLTTADASAITLYTTTASSQLYLLSARIMSTVGTSATYTIKWTEGGVVITKALTITAVDTDQDLSILIQPDTASAITVQLTSVTSSTVNVAAALWEVA